MAVHSTGLRPCIPASPTHDLLWAARRTRKIMKIVRRTPLEKISYFSGLAVSCDWRLKTVN